MRSSLALLLIGLVGCGLSQPTKFERAAEQFRMAKWDAAIGLCDEVIQEDPKDADAWLLRGRCYLGKGMPKRAIEDYTQAMHLAPEDPEPRYHRAIAYERVSQPLLAQKDHEIARQLDLEVKKASAMHQSPFPDRSEWEGLVKSLENEKQTRVDGTTATDKRKDGQSAALDQPFGFDGIGDPLADRGLKTLDDGQTSNHTERGGDALSRPRRARTTIERPFQMGTFAVTSRGNSKVPKGGPYGIDSPRRLAPTGRFPYAGMEPGSAGKGGESKDGKNKKAPLATDDEEQPEPRGAEEQRDELDAPEDSEPDEQPTRPTLPSGTLQFPDDIGQFAPQTGYPYRPELSTPRTTGSYLERLYSVPRSPALRPGPNRQPLKSTGRQATGYGPIPRLGQTNSAAPHGFSMGANLPGQVAAGQPPVVTGPRVLTTPPRAGARTAPSPPPQYRVPFPPSPDLPTTGIVRSYDEGL